jgi:hypothetical protein
MPMERRTEVQLQVGLSAVCGPGTGRVLLDLKIMLRSVVVFIPINGTGDENPDMCILGTIYIQAV